MIIKVRFMFIKVVNTLYLTENFSGYKFSFRHIQTTQEEERRKGEGV
jgi:hypothetical protein